MGSESTFRAGAPLTSLSPHLAGTTVRPTGLSLGYPWTPGRCSVCPGLGVGAERPSWQHLQSEVQRRVRGCRRLVHPGQRCLPEWRLWPDSGGRCTPPHTPRVPRGSRKGGPGPGISALDVEVLRGPGSLDPRPLSALCEHRACPPAHPTLGQLPCPARAGPGAHTLAAPPPRPDSPGAPRPPDLRRPPGAAHHCSGHPPSLQSTVCPTEA